MALWDKDALLHELKTDRDYWKSSCERSRKELLEICDERRFTAAVAAMQGLLTDPNSGKFPSANIALWSVEQADALLKELDRTKFDESGES